MNKFIESCLVASVFVVYSFHASSQVIDFSQSDGFGTDQNTVQINNIRVDNVLENPFDPAHPTIESSTFNVPFVFDPITLHLVPNVSGAVLAGDDGACTNAIFNVSNAFTGEPVSGATVAIGSQTVTSDPSGAATIFNLPEGLHSVTVASQEFDTLVQSIPLSCTEDNAFGVALNPATGTIGGLTVGELRIVLSWGENPGDLDSHLTGPDASGGDARFHVYFSDTVTDIASLDVDDTSSFGPETITISPVIGGSTLRPGLYRYSVHHYSGSGTISTSSSTVRLSSASGSINRTFTPPAGAFGSNDVWTVFELLVDDLGVVTIFPIDTFTPSISANNVRSLSVDIPTNTGYGSVEYGVDWNNLPSK